MTQLKETESDLLASALNGDSQAAGKLVLRHRGMLVKFANRYQSRWVTFDDLFHDGVVVFLRGIRSFDPGRGVKFITYIWDAVHREIAISAAKSCTVMGRMRKGYYRHPTVYSIWRTDSLDYRISPDNENRSFVADTWYEVDFGESDLLSWRRNAIASAIRKRLSSRERFVLERWLAGHSGKSTAKVMNVSKARVYQLIRRAFVKLGGAFLGLHHDPHDS